MKDFVSNSKLIDEWDWNKNNELGFNPNKLTLGSGKKPWWICKLCGHSYTASVDHRNNGRGCPNCAKGYQTSSQELKLYFYVKKYFGDAISGYSDKNNNITEIDVYIPSLRIGIEYDGGRWHQNIENDKFKDHACVLNGIYLIRIREQKCPKYESTCTFVNLTNESMDELKNAFCQIFHILHIDDIDINFDRDLNEIENFVIHHTQQNSLLNKFPEIAEEWNRTKNGNLKPDNVSQFSSKRVWWQCTCCGCEYVASVSNRTRKHSGCPVCAGNHPKVVYCQELDRIFNSTGEAERETGVFHGHISRCINGKLKHAGRHPITGIPLTWIEMKI